MTAEIAILNKSAVALATDSAVTISVGNEQEKIFDSADKLFELTNSDPIGVMIYNTMDFMGTPLAVLVKEFRKRCAEFDTVSDAAKAFLQYLQDDGKTAPDLIKNNLLISIFQPFFKALQEEIDDKILEAIRAGDLPEDFKGFSNDILEKSIDRRLKILKQVKVASFVGATSTKITLDKNSKDLLARLTSEFLPNISKSNNEKLLEFCISFVRKDIFSNGKTGIVIAGFGKKDRFPSLIWFETDGMLCGHLKYKEADFVDVDRSGTRAAVMPFAQKDMIERFLYGLDESIERNINEYCREAVPEIAKSLLTKAELKNGNDLASLKDQAHSAENEFLDKLEEGVFKQVRETSRKGIEDMVEFMPKPEMAKMAEALIDLTSIKRRVTRGMETVGGPVDVAVISKSEGFVWVKRKHYFSSELNGRYVNRLLSQKSDSKPSKGGSNE